MQSKAKVHYDVATFCQMLIYNNLDSDGVGPDFVRLKNRFEVTNGVHESNDDNITMRAMSYCTMIGDTPEINNLIEKYEWPIEVK